jgi:hypothetical protein
MRKTALIMSTALLLAMTGLVAQAATTTSKTTTRTMVITAGALGTPSAGACSAVSTDYASICPSGACQCESITNAKITGNLAGTGTADVALTEDTGDVSSTSGCMPFYGTITTTSNIGAGKKKVSANDIINAVGAVCPDAAAGGKTAIEGGFGLNAANSQNGATGSGTVSGSSDSKTIKILLKGPVTE